MAKAAILYCKKVKDHSCIACAKCFKGIQEKNGEFSRFDEIELVAMTDCGDCPGILVPRLKLLNEITKNLDRKIEVLYMGTCLKLAMETAKCPIDFEESRMRLGNKFSVEIILGTHTY
jgi:predicted metal-binding protein